MNPIPDAPTVPEAMAVYTVAAAQARLHQVRKAAQNADRGFVSWDAAPAPNTSVHWSQHKLSFLEAVHTGLAFCDTRLADEWLVIGRAMLPLIRTMPGFDERVGVQDEQMMSIGRIKGVSVYYDWKIRSHDFVTGCGDKAAKGTVVNLPINFAESGQQAHEPRVWLP